MIMRLFVLLSMASSAHSFDFTRRCLLLRDKCVTHCPKNMHPYHTRCDTDTISQRSCSNPEPYTLGFTCGWSRCDCNSPLFMTNDGLCVIEENCVSETKPRRHQHRRGKNRPPHRLPSKITFRKDTDEVIVEKGDKEISYVPMYTGHCPLLKFRYGKCYGDNTRQILREIRSKGLFNKPFEYRPGDNYELANMPRRDAPSRDVYDGLNNRQPVYMTGYTGYVPGMNFRYGKSYGRSADDCMADFTDKQRQLRRKADITKTYTRSRSAPKMETVHSRDEVRRDLNRFREINKYKENIISPEFPPIAGYTGHIPRIKGSEASLSQRYHCAAKRGLELIRLERDKRTELDTAGKNIREILKDKDNKKYSYWNWG